MLFFVLRFLVLDVFLIEEGPSNIQEGSLERSKESEFVRGPFSYHISKFFFESAGEMRMLDLNYLTVERYRSTGGEIFESLCCII